VTAESDAMAARLRPVLASKRLELMEKKMFGGIGFMHRGNMLVGTTAKGALLVRIDPAKADEALARPGAFQMHMGPRPMTGFIGVDEEGIPDEAALNGWIDYATKFVKTLPPK
jgi:TfoX/Sxy family transcriptional regulator of competence genes